VTVCFLIGLFRLYDRKERVLNTLADRRAEGYGRINGGDHKQIACRSLRD